MVGWYATKYKISRSRNGTQARCGQLPLEGLKRPIIGVNLSIPFVPWEVVHALKVTIKRAFPLASLACLQGENS